MTAVLGAGPGTAAAEAEARVPWHALDAAEVVLRIGSGPGGLTSGEAERRLLTYGPNALHREHRWTKLRLLLGQVSSPLMLVLIGAGVVALLLGKTEDGLVVLGAVVVNAIIGFVQEHKAGRAIQALMSMVPEEATVVRDGVQRSVPVADLVPGDLIRLAAGDKVPADARVLESANLRVDEASLTGESLPVDKTVEPVDAEAVIGDRTSLVFSGSLVTYGAGSAVAVGTGQRSELGRISAMLDEATEPDTPLTRALRRIGKVITVGIALLAVVVLVVGTVRAIAQGVGPLDAVRESLLFAIAMAVGAIPEGLPAIVTIALAIGVQRMAARNAIVRNLPAIETLGSTTVIATDKTGTLTRNEMTATTVWTPSGETAISGVGYEPVGHLERDGAQADAPDARHLLLAGALCSDATLERTAAGVRATGDPTEIALVVGAEKAGVDVGSARDAFPRIATVPFDAEHAFMATLHQDGDGRFALLKGAPEAVLPRVWDAAGGALDRAAVLAEVESMARGGLRVLAIGRRSMEPGRGTLSADDVDGFTLLGLVGMIDPPRQEAVDAIAACRSAGITVKMITGDHRETAAAIGREIGIAAEDDGAITGAELARMDDDELERSVARTGIFARVAPEHKLRLVRALQRRGEVAAMTGDGVNDAPALRQADIGVAMGVTGTSVSKEASDVVLADDNFASIRAAVEEGRRAFDNLVKALAFVLPTNLGLALILLVAVSFFAFDAVTQELLLPMSPTQILWINLVASVALGVPLAFEAPEPDLMQRRPRDPQAPLLSRFVVFRTALVATLMTAGSVLLFLYEYHSALDAGVSHALALAEAQTMAVTTVVMFQIFYVLNCRSLSRSIWEIGVLSNRAIYLGIAGLLLLQLAFVYAPVLNAVFGSAPISAAQFGMSVLVGALILPVIAIEKRIRARRAERA